MPEFISKLVVEQCGDPGAWLDRAPIPLRRFGQLDEIDPVKSLDQTQAPINPLRMGGKHVAHGPQNWPCKSTGVALALCDGPEHAVSVSLSVVIQNARQRAPSTSLIGS